MEFEELKDAVIKLTAFTMAFIDAKKEDSPGGEEIVWTEYPTIGLKAVQAIPLFGNLDVIADQLRSINDQSKVTIKEAFAKEFNLQNDVAEFRIERTMAFILEGGDYYNDMKRGSNA